MGATSRYRFRAYDTQPAPSAPTYAAVCVSGEETDCGETSGDLLDPAEVTRWTAQHSRDTGHTSYQRRTVEPVTVTPGAWQ